MTYHETGSKDVVELNLNTNPTKSVSCCAWFLPPEIIFVSSGPQSCKIITIMMMIIIHLAVKHKFTVQTMRSRRRLNLCKCVSAACALRQKDNFVEPWGGTSSKQITKKKKPRKTKNTFEPLRQAAWSGNLWSTWLSEHFWSVRLKEAVTLRRHGFVGSAVPDLITHRDYVPRSF